jgi:hypothetical protein
VNGVPIMNELEDPWVNWVSFHRSVPAVPLSGETLTIVRESAPDLNHEGRASLAGDLERIIEGGIGAAILGTPGSAPGLGAQTVAGSAPGGLAHLLEAVFCQTELNYLSALNTVPTQLFLDPEAVAAAGIVAPESTGPVRFAFQIPVRSRADRMIELSLVRLGFLGARTATAIRLVDDENDVFSELRCGILSAIDVATLDATTPASVDPVIRAAVRSKLDAGALFDGNAQPQRLALMRALLDSRSTAAEISAARRAYFAEAKARYAAAVTRFTSGDTAAAEARVAARKAKACAMFDGGGPLPLLTQDGTSGCPDTPNPGE